MTWTGMYAALTPHGQDLVNNPTYGLRTGVHHAIRSTLEP